MNKDIAIIGAGMAGLIAARIFPGATIYDRAPGFKKTHTALMRFRTSVIEQITGIKMERSVVDKSIYHNGQLHQSCNPRLGNLYSAKVSGKIERRSIWNMGSVERYIPPADFHEMLFEPVEDRVVFNSDIDHIMRSAKGAVINTIPLDALLDLPWMQTDAYLDSTRKLLVEHQGDAIETATFDVECSCAHQTIYFPNPASCMYRATLNGNTMIAEFVGGIDPIWNILETLNCSFGLAEGVLRNPKMQPNGGGKLSPLPESARKAAMLYLTETYELYSLGRYATWRNVLLDDVVQDATRIRDMIFKSDYDKALGK